jgi:hypothetical protein
MKQVANKQGVGQKQIVITILALAVLLVLWGILKPVFGDTDETIDDRRNDLKDFDGDGIYGINDACECTTGETQRDLDGGTYCVADQPPNNFDELRSSWPEDNTQLEDGLKIREGTVYYSSQVCDTAIQNDLWPRGN